MTDDLRLASLLNELVVEDDALEAPEAVEERTLASWDAWQQTRGSTDRGAAWRRRASAVAAAAVAAGFAVATAVGRIDVWDDRAPSSAVSAPQQSVEPRPAAGPQAAAVATNVDAGSDAPPAPYGRNAPGLPPPDATETWAFIRLTPGPDGDLSGSFQIARVRVPGRVLVDLGVLRLPDDGRNADVPIEADVMFGDDGLARAIRVMPISRRVP